MEGEKISGVIERIIFKNEDNGYYVLELDRDNTGKITDIVTVNHIGITEGMSFEFEGQYVTNNKFGRQFKASRAFEVKPTSKKAIISYLSSNFFKGIGPVMAKKIVEKFGDKTVDIINEDISRLKEVQGISKKKLKVISEAWQKNSEINSIMLFLQQYSISNLLAVRIYEFYGRDCINQIKKNPYKLAKDIRGIGFIHADRVALDVGFAKDCFERISAGIMHVLSESENDGHCYLLHNQILQRTSELLGGVDVGIRIDEVLDLLIDTNEIKRMKLNGDEEYRYYNLQIFYDETFCANKIDILNSNTFNYKQELIDRWLAERENDNVRMSDDQRNSIVQIVNQSCSCLTGGPGVGKTFTLQRLVKLLDEILGVRVALCAPTGRAAKRMTEVIGTESQTIHRLLGWDPVNGGFVHNEHNVLDSQYIIVDESSMIDIRLAASLLRALPQDAQILFVGDYDQLPPVGSGSFFKDLIESGCVKTMRLNKIFRQADGSSIVEVAHKMIHGNVPTIPSPLETPELWRNGCECMFIDAEIKDANKNFSDYPQWHAGFYNYDVLGMIKELYTNTIKKYKGKNLEIQCLSPMNKGELGSEKINEILQEAVNPSDGIKKELKVANRTFREMDKIIHVVNNYTLGIFNGTIGYIVSIDVAEKTAVINYDGNMVNYQRDDLLELKLAYCISVHKSQGSEFDLTIICLGNCHYRLLMRNLVYTALTRSRQLCIFVGQRSALATSINNKNSQIRQTSLKELLQNKNQLNLIQSENKIN